MEKFFVTFRQGTEYFGTYVEVHAVDRQAANTAMLRAHTARWQQIHREKEFDGGGLKRLCVLKQQKPNPDEPGEARFFVDFTELAA